MTRTHYDLYEKYYRITVGKFFTKEQCRRLLSLLASSQGMDLHTEAYRGVLYAVDTVEAHDITGFVDSKNFQLLCDILEEDPEVITAATALSAVYEDLSSRHAPHYAGLVERTIALRTANPRTNEVRLELAYLEYALGDLEDAGEELRALADRACFESVGHLACLSIETGNLEGAYHYLTLLEKIYERELELTPEAWIGARLRALETKLSATTVAAIRENVHSLPPFLTGTGDVGSPIGFNPTTTRSFAYEH